jgi:hypothetical protein
MAPLFTPACLFRPFRPWSVVSAMGIGIVTYILTINVTSFTESLD